jgi:predicted flap endonuclease-1-like 5' DNA nuclease
MADTDRIDHRDGGFPNIGQPALRALTGVGVTRLEQLTAWHAADIAALHGMGPKGVRLLAEALAAVGLAFRVA